MFFSISINTSNTLSLSTFSSLSPSSALQQLSYTVDVVFNKINVKLNSEKEKITKINERVGVCSGKINSVRGSNKATTVFSTAKFPAPKKLIPRPTLFSINEDVSTSL